MKTKDFIILSILSIIIFIPACWIFPEMAIPLDPPTENIVIDTCEQDTFATVPKFVNLYADYGIHPASLTHVYAGGDTLVWIPGEQGFSDSMEVFLKNIWPQYDFKCYGAHPEQMGLIIIGSDDSKYFARNIKFKTSFAYGTFGDIPYGMFLMGQATFEEFDTLSKDLQSVKWINFRGDYDSLQLTTLARNVLGKCKLGGKWVDFRFNNFPIDSALVDSFHLAQWEKVLE